MTDAQYDDPVFFSRYRQMRLQRSGLHEELEQPALAHLLPQGPAGSAVTSCPKVWLTCRPSAIR